MSEKISGGAAIVNSLIRHGVDTVFGLPGAQMYPLYDALKTQQNRIKTFTTRHEQGAAYMAYGYAKSTGKPGVFTVVPGPGMLNATSALCTATAATSPVLCLTGQIPSEFLGRGRGHLHELPDQLATMRSLVKWAERIDSPQQAPMRVAEAFRHMQSGRQGPAALEMCWDVMAGQGPVAPVEPLPLEPAPEPDPDAIEAAADILAGAKKPMIMVGGGALHAGEEVLALADLLDAPVVSYRSGRGIVSEREDLGISCATGWHLWEDTDALIGIGSRCELQYMRWSGMGRRIDRPEAPPHLIRIDIDPMEFVRLKPHAGILADAGAGTRLLAEAVAKKRKKVAGARERIAEAKGEIAKRIEKVQPHVSYLRAIRDVLPEDGILVQEICQAGFTSLFAFPVYAPRTYISSAYQDALGFGFLTALGVKAGNPDKAVVSINGDGGFLFGIQELATAAKYGIGLVSIVFNNGAFGNVRRDQLTRFDGRTIGSDLVNPDFPKLAESFGIAGYRVDSAEALRPVLEKALAADAPALIEVPIAPDSEVSPWEFIMRG